MKPLLDTDSPTYLRRLVKELNSLPDGFYARASCFNIRCYRARLRGGALQVASHSASPTWFESQFQTFEDVYGREIVASRKSI